MYPTYKYIKHLYIKFRAAVKKQQQKQTINCKSSFLKANIRKTNTMKLTWAFTC